MSVRAPSAFPHTVVVVGSGIVGAATAYFLAKQGVEVRLIEAVAPAAEATGAADGAVSVASKRPGPMMAAALSGVRLYRELAEAGLFSGLFKSRSTFIVAASEAECSVLQTHAAALSAAGVRVDLLSQAMVRQRMPAVSGRALMAVEVHDEGHAIGYQIVHRLLTAAGIVVQRRTMVEGILSGARANVVRGVMTQHGPVEGDAVVVAAGTGSGRLLGLSDVLMPRKGQLLVTERAPELNAGLPGAIMSGRYLLSKGSQGGGQGAPARGLGLVIDPLRTGQFLIGGTREDHGDRLTNDVGAVAQILRDAVALLPGLAHVRLLRSFAGNRTAVADGLPLIGRVSGCDNLYVATGFEGDGICLGPLTGKAVADLVCGREPSFDLRPFDPARFGVREVAA
ncbi:FAD-binding oxidoreductase [Nitratireductor sp. ZSWI3]|uniref:NAD(P)/FAD-dependent oxidoreductase n=1 Tax=Nitratireductor sp. ZSWI3 TaxID=2966359 RepID=UPI0021500894|nr:FAD-binding oxidoreductase [Nitratireductor sp. ZSWI3]MCR4264601.1 FAD-binding oxidoreductase [Nitratireductor sp. ZSWI3]